MGWAGLPENKGRPSPFGGCGLLRFPAALWAQRQTAGTAGLNALPGSQGGSGSASVGVCLWFGAPSFMTRAVFTVFSHRQNFLFFFLPQLLPASADAAATDHSFRPSPVEGTGLASGLRCDGNATAWEGHGGPRARLPHVAGCLTALRRRSCAGSKP